MKVNGKRDIGTFLISIIITEGTGYLSSVLTRGSQNIYNTLKRPWFSPPPWVFPIVWIVLFFLMGLALYRIVMLQKQGEDVKKPITLFTIQLVLNFLWPILFFRLRLIGLAFFELIILIIFILLTTVSFYKKDKIAGYLFIPYLLWSMYGAVLNYFIWSLNNM
ncbi:TspO/MBR family protein [Haloimpatiens sp. FM7330]|uniref:TspO/MBR family protein n=1 Tax=Haloimpatiens sp. FM7330 TaxID=3298610 RepID=UPI003629025B